jgi:hypothetical protein
MKTSAVILLAIFEGVVEPKKYPQNDFIKHLTSQQRLGLCRTLRQL